MKLHIAEMLEGQKPHISFHTPGHKRAGADITELSYSDCLLSPTGVIARAERDIAEILGAERSFLLTDGSTSGVFSMLAAISGRRVALPAFSHPSVFHALGFLQKEAVLIPCGVEAGIPLQPKEEEIERALSNADALLLTSPDYYGFFPPLAFARELTLRVGKPFLIDGAHGSHLHFTERHAGKFADMWVDGVHKSLPALTQGAVVSARKGFEEALGKSVKLFRTTSPSYPIMASVEYAVKYPRNEAIERAAERFKMQHGCVKNDDWTKILVPIGPNAPAVGVALEEEGVYAEFCDGNYLLFYLSPCTKEEDLKKLGALLRRFPRGKIMGEGRIPMYSEEP